MLTIYSTCRLFGSTSFIINLKLPTHSESVCLFWFFRIYLPLLFTFRKILLISHAIISVSQSLSVPGNPSPEQTHLLPFNTFDSDLSIESWRSINEDCGLVPKSVVTSEKLPRDPSVPVFPFLVHYPRHKRSFILDKKNCRTLIP